MERLFEAERITGFLIFSALNGERKVEFRERGVNLLEEVRFEDERLVGFLILSEPKGVRIDDFRNGDCRLVVGFLVVRRLLDA